MQNDQGSRIGRLARQSESSKGLTLQGSKSNPAGVVQLADHSDTAATERALTVKEQNGRRRDGLVLCHRGNDTPVSALDCDFHRHVAAGGVGIGAHLVRRVRQLRGDLARSTS